MQTAPALRTLLLSVLLCAPLTAQQMPDPSQMAGRPLPAPELSTGMVSVRVVRERMGNNVAGQPVSLRAAGKTLSATTDAQGRATFGDVPVGTAITVDAVVDGETLRSQEFVVPAQGGTRVALIAGLAAAATRDQAARDVAAKQPARAGVVVFGGESRVVLEFQDDTLQVFYLLDVVNGALTPIDVGAPLFLELPEGATGAGALEGSSTQAVVQGRRVRINGPFPPGSTPVRVGYRMPYSGDRLTIEQPWPATFEQLFVAAQKVGPMRMSSPQLQQQQEATASERPFLMGTGGRINAGESLSLTLEGLPARSTWLRDIGVGVGLLVLAVGLYFGIRGSAPAVDVAALRERQEQLLAELVGLEERRRAGRAHTRDEARRVKAKAQLELVMEALDRAAPGGTGLAA